jgi:hypothetical protein
MEKDYFDVWPIIVPADQESEINVAPKFKHCEFDDASEISVHYVRDDGKFIESGYAGWNQYSRVDATFENGVLKVKVFFAGECEHSFKVIKTKDGAEQELGVFNIYSLDDDLFRLRPYKGDFHLHSYCSDGKESPAYVAASSRRIGLDFMALTDHRQYKPSLEAMAAMAELETDLKCFPGEEVHPPDNMVHIVNFGGNFSVNAMMEEEADAYRAGVANRETEMLEISEHARYQVASSEWVFDKIKAAGGIAMYCHPYWRPLNRFYINAEVNEQLVTRQNFDILEVIGGFYRNQMESNALAVAMYHEKQAKGQVLPVAGVSDSHGCDGDLFGWYYTIIMAASDKFEDLAAGIKAVHSVAIESVPDEFPRVVGPFRLVKFVYFLLREFYPVHDRLCEEEGMLMLGHLAGDKTASSRLAALKGRVPALFDKYWKV